MASVLPDVLMNCVISYLDCEDQQKLGALGFKIYCNIICFRGFKSCKTHYPDFYNTIDKMSRKINKYNELSCPIHFKNKEQCSFALKMMKKIIKENWLNNCYKCCNGTGISFYERPTTINTQNNYTRRILNVEYKLSLESKSVLTTFLEKKESKKVVNQRLKKINRRSRREKYRLKNKFKNKHRNNKYQKKGRKERRFRHGA